MQSSDSPDANREGNLIDVRRLFLVVRERWIGALVCAVLVSGLLAWGLLRQIPVYATTSTLLVERSNDRVVDIKQVVDNSVDSSLTDALLLTHIQQIRSRTFLARAIASLTPGERASTLAAYPPAKKSANPLLKVDASAQLASPSPDKVEKDPSAPPSEESRLEDLISRNLKVERSGRTLLITLTMRHRDPAAAQFLANKLVDEYIAFLIDRATASNDSALVFLKREADDLRERVEAAEQNVQAYREKNNLFFIEQNQNIVSQRLRELSNSVTQARVRRQSLDAHVDQVEKITRGETDARSLASLPEFGAFASVQRQIDELRAKRDVLAESKGAKHPAMLDNATSLETLQRLRTQQIDAALADLRNQRDRALTDEKQLGVELAAAEKESLRYDQLAVEYNSLRSAVETTRATYATILSRLNETTISSRLQNTNIKFTDPAVMPVQPVEPNRMKILFIVGAMGALAFFGYPLTADKLDTRIKSWSDVEHYLKAPLLGEIDAANAVATPRRAGIVINGLDEEVAEGFRTLNNQIQLSSKERGPKTILVTSTIPSEGKSFVVSNLGASFAAHGSRTLLIDVDFRRPNLHRGFKVSNENGILAWLSSGAEVTPEVAQDKTLGITQVGPGLFLLPSGGESRKLTELLVRGRFTPLIRQLQKDFDLIILDTPPAGVFPDAEACCSLATEFFYVCRFAGPERLHTRQTLDRLRQRDAAFLGVVINAVPPGRTGAYALSGWGHGRRHYKSYYARR